MCKPHFPFSLITPFLLPTSPSASHPPACARRGFILPKKYLLESFFLSFFFLNILAVSCLHFYFSYLDASVNSTSKVSTICECWCLFSTHIFNEGAKSDRTEHGPGPTSSSEQMGSSGLSGTPLCVCRFNPPRSRSTGASACGGRGSLNRGANRMAVPHL